MLRLRRPGAGLSWVRGESERVLAGLRRERLTRCGSRSRPQHAEGVAALRYATVTTSRKVLSGPIVVTFMPVPIMPVRPGIVTVFVRSR